MDEFLKNLAARTQSDTTGRSWILVLEDQLSEDIGPLCQENPQSIGIVLIESHWKARRRPYHQHKIAFHLANLRHFALEQAERGVAVRYLTTAQPFRTTLKSLIQELGPLRVMEPAEFEVRQDLAPLVKKGSLILLPHEGWLTSRQDFLEGSGSKPPWRMDAFYRYVRKKTGILMKGTLPLGGQFSFDPENRKPWKGNPQTPKALRFPTDTVKEEVIRFVESHFKDHPGSIHPEFLPGTKQDAHDQWTWAQTFCLPHFGPYEDAMAQEERSLFHTHISALLNVHRLLPRQVIRDVERLSLPLASKEGFIRQVLGWREFVHHVHYETQGFRKNASTTSTPGNAGYQKWGNRKWRANKNPKDLDGGATPSFLNAQHSLPGAYWGTASGFNCLDQVIEQVWEEGYSHHITRLMVLSNIATLLDVSPRELTDWFWVAYTDAFDWVVEPNVLAMGTFGTGPLMTTKPYVSGAVYIHRMSNFCDTCAFNPKTNCPLTPLYWAFLKRHQSKLQSNPRLSLPLKNLQKRGPDQIRIDQHVFKTVGRVLRKRKRITPEHLKTAFTAGRQTKNSR